MEIKSRPKTDPGLSNRSNSPTNKTGLRTPGFENQFSQLEPNADKSRSSFLTSSIFISIAIAGLFLGILLVFNFAFDNIPNFIGSFHIPMATVVYAMGIYVIKDKVVSLSFLLVVPLIMFMLERGRWNKEFMQMFLDYFVAFYVFVLCYLIKPMVKLTTKQSVNPKTKRLIEVGWIMFFYTICTSLKFFIHTAVGAIYFTNNDWLASFYVNGFWMANAVLTIPVLFAAAPIILMANERLELTLKSKY